jgi:glutamyl-tRNA synthetase
MAQPIRTRFAPSPTGTLHIGSVRTALFCWLYARRHGGQFVLRVEDTDRLRSTEESVTVIIEAMKWFGLDADEGPYFQTQRFERYREVAAQMIADGRAYRCYCTTEELTAMREQATARGEKPRYDGRCRDRREPRDGVAPAVRFRNPDDGKVVVEDLVHGPVVFDNTELDDLVILRSDASPTYHFSVVIDDVDMKISHVIRGDDHLNNTPRHVNLFRALGAPVPLFAHLPMIAGPDGAKLSKRHGAVSVLEYREQGYLPDALLNYLVRLGWAHGDQELFSRDEMIALFDLAAVQKSPARFDVEKLKWINQQHIKSAPAAALAVELRAQLDLIGVPASGIPAATLEQLVDAFRERAQTLREMAEKSRVYVTDDIAYEQKATQKHLQESATEALRQTHAALGSLEQWTETSTQAAVEAVASSAGIGLGKVAQPLRVAVTGSAASPGIGITLQLIGRERTLARIERALEMIGTPKPGQA